MPEKPLITEIVNSKKGSDTRQQRLLPIDGVEKNGNERGLLVVAVNDVGRKARCLYRLQDRP